VGLISCVVVVDPEIALGLERERHSAVLGKGIVHLMRACVYMHVDHGVMTITVCRGFFFPVGVEKRT
jgi:hypothetical protein